MNRHGTPVRALARRCSSAVSSIGCGTYSRASVARGDDHGAVHPALIGRSPIRHRRPYRRGVTTATPTRNLTLDGVFNFRDLGGYTDRRRARRALAHDLPRRRPRPADRRRPRGAPPDRAARRGRPAHRARARRARPVPVRDVSGDVPPPLRHRPDVGPRAGAARGPAADGVPAPRLPRHPRRGRAALRRCRSPCSPTPMPCPAVFHCAAGKDRTGLLAALLLGSLGVAHDDIVEDYALTQATMDRFLAVFATEDPEAAPAHRRHAGHVLHGRPGGDVPRARPTSSASTARSAATCARSASPTTSCRLRPA